MNFIRKIPLAFLSAVLIFSWVSMAEVYAQGIGSPIFPGPGTPNGGGGGGGCTSNGPLDVVGETAFEAVGMRALTKSYSGPVLLMSVTGTSGTYFNVGLSGCNLDTSMLSACTTLSAPTSSSGCPVEAFYDQSGHGCNPAQTNPSLQGYVYINDSGANNHPTVVFPSTPYYGCTLGSSITAATYASEVNFINFAGFVYSAPTMQNTDGDITVSLIWNSGSTLLKSFDGSTASYSGGTTDNGSQNNYISQIPATGGAVLTVNGVDGGAGTSISVEGATLFYLSSGDGPAEFRFAEEIGFSLISGCTGSSGDCNALYTNMHAYWQ